MVLSHTCLLALSPALAPGSTQAAPKAFTPDLFHCYVFWFAMGSLSDSDHNIWGGAPFDLLPHSCLSYLQACVPKATAQHHSPESQQLWSLPP